MFYRWLIFLHIFGAIAFVYAHSVSAVVAFRLRSERDPQRIRTIIELYSTGRMFGLLYGSLLLLLAGGVAAGFLGHWWGFGWIWLSIILLIAISVSMYAIGSKYYSRVRQAIGMESMQGGKVQEAGMPASLEELDALLNRSPAQLLLLIGGGGMAVILWLMIFKPF
jgi:hypothetical protein